MRKPFTYIVTFPLDFGNGKQYETEFKCRALNAWDAHQQFMKTTGNDSFHWLPAKYRQSFSHMEKRITREEIYWPAVMVWVGYPVLMLAGIVWWLVCG